MKPRLNNREIGFLVSGLLVGLLIGMTIIGTMDDLRDSLFGTASTKPNKDVAFYLVDLTTAQDWLLEKNPDNTANNEQIKEAADVLTKLPEGFEFRAAFVKAKDDGYVDAQLQQMYAALVGVEDVEKLKVDSSNETSVCLGLDDDPYGEQAVYFYLTIPTSQVKKLNIPDAAEWKQLDKPQENTLYWELLACYPETAE